MDGQPDTLPHDAIDAPYDAALDPQREFSSSRDDAEPPRRAPLPPHLRRAASLRGRLQRAELAGYLNDALLAATRSAAFVVDRDLAVLYAGGRVEALTSAAAPLRCHQGRLTADAHAGMPPLADMVALAIDGATPPQSPPPSYRLHRHGQAPLIVSVAPMATPNGPLAVVWLRSPATAAGVAAPALRQRYDLTPAEAAVAQALADGGSPAQIAQSRHVSVNTVKTHLHHIYRKTATSRQGELVALLHGQGGLPPPTPGVKNRGQK